MPTEVDVRLLTVQDQEVSVRVAATRLEVGLQLSETEWTGIVWVTVAVEVEDLGEAPPKLKIVR
jgi:hypothetical protein